MPSEPAQFFVPGNPKAQGSKRHVGHGIMVEASKDLPAWRTAIASMASSYRHVHHAQFSGPVQVRFVFWFHRPKNHYRTGKYAGTVKDSAPRWHSSAPDVDKLCRAVADALTISGLILDDRLIARIHAEKLYGDPGVLIEVADLEESPCIEGGRHSQQNLSPSPPTTERTTTAALSTSSTTSTDA